MPHSPYGGNYRRARLAVIGRPCWQCGRLATTADHDPPLSSVPPGTRWNGVLRPMCVPCMREQAGRLGGSPFGAFRRSRRW